MTTPKEHFERFAHLHKGNLVHYLQYEIEAMIAAGEDENGISRAEILFELKMMSANLPDSPWMLYKIPDSDLFPLGRHLMQQNPKWFLHEDVWYLK